MSLEDFDLSSFGSQIKTTKFDFKFEKMRYELKGGKVILSEVTGALRNGRVTAIMGPSVGHIMTYSYSYWLGQWKDNFLKCFNWKSCQNWRIFVYKWKGGRDVQV
jgi:hypothetical protein